MTTPDLRVYLVTADDIPVGRLDTIVAAAVAGGVGTVQLRAKQAGTNWRIAQLERWREQLPRHVTLLVNDDVEAAAAVEGVGVHVGPDDRHPAAVRDRLGPDVVIGWSLHAGLDDPAAWAAVDYVAASPVWATVTKTDTTAPWDLAGVRRLRAALPPGLPLVGIGGIDAGNAAEVITAGADGVAVVSAICSAADPRAAAAALLAAVRHGEERRAGAPG